MKYKLGLSPKINVSAPSASGAFFSAPASGYGGSLPTPQPTAFYAWQPSTWPPAPATVDERFVETLKQIFEDSILSEIANVISDAHKCNGDLQHRGHVVAISLLCALDAISSYGYGARCGKQIPEFVRAHFPREYHVHAGSLLVLYRHAMIHSWNLFEVAIYPGNERIAAGGESVSFGLLNFFDALVQATESFLEQLLKNPTLHTNTIVRYGRLKNSAKP